MSNRKYRPGTTTATHQGEPSSPEYLVKKAETPMEAFQRLFFDGGDNVISMEELIRDPKGALHLMLDQFDVAVDEQAQQAEHHQQKRDEALAKLGQTKQLREVIAGMYQKVGGDEPVVKAPVTKLITKPLVASPPPVFNYRIPYLARIHPVVVLFLQGCNRIVKRIDVQRYIEENVVDQGQDLTHNERADYVHQVVGKLVTAGLVSRPGWGQYKWEGGLLGQANFINNYGEVVPVDVDEYGEPQPEAHNPFKQEAKATPALLLQEWQRLDLKVGSESNLQRDVFQVLWEEGPLSINALKARFNDAAWDGLDNEAPYDYHQVSAAVYGLQHKSAVVRIHRGTYRVNVAHELLTSEGRMVDTLVEGMPGATVDIYNARSGRKVSIGVTGMDAAGRVTTGGTGVQSAGGGSGEFSRAAVKGDKEVPWAGVKMTPKQRAVVEALAQVLEYTGFEYAHYNEVSRALPQLTDASVHSLLSRLVSLGVVERQGSGTFALSQALLTAPVPQLNAKGKLRQWTKYADRLLADSTPPGGWSASRLVDHLKLRYGSVTQSQANGQLNRRTSSGQMARVVDGYYLWIEGLGELEVKTRLAALRKYWKEDPQANYREVMFSLMAQSPGVKFGTAMLRAELYARGIDVTNNAVFKYVGILVKDGTLQHRDRGEYLWTGGKHKPKALFPLPERRNRKRAQTKRKQHTSSTPKLVGKQGAWSKVADEMLQKRAESQPSTDSWTPKWLQDTMQAHGFPGLKYAATFSYVKKCMEKGLIVKVAEGLYRWELPKRPVLDDMQDILACGGEWNVDDMHEALKGRGHQVLTRNWVAEKFRQFLKTNLLFPGKGKDMFIWAGGEVVPSNSLMKKGSEGEEPPPESAQNELFNNEFLTAVGGKVQKSLDESKGEQANKATTDAPLRSRGRTRRVVLGVLEDADSPLSPLEVEKRAKDQGYHSVNYKTVIWHLRQLVNDGEVVKPADGLYQVKA